MEKSIKITLIIVSAVIFLALIAGYLIFQVMPTNTVSANGEATIKAMPDLVSVYFSIQTEGKTAQEAKDENSEILENVVSELIKQGFERKEIVTENFNVYPEYNWINNKQQLIGYTSTRSLKLEIAIEDYEKIGEVIDAGVNAGALVNYINFELTQESQNMYKAEALKLSAEDAKTKAGAIAEGLGKKLGRLVSTSSSDFYYAPWNVYSSDLARAEDVGLAKQAVIDIQPGERETSARISVTYKLR